MSARAAAVVVGCAFAIAACSLSTDVPDLTSGNGASSSSSGASGATSGGTSGTSGTSSSGVDGSASCPRRSPATHFEDSFDTPPADRNWTSSDATSGATVTLDTADAGGGGSASALVMTVPVSGGRTEIVKRFATTEDSHIVVELDLFVDVPISGTASGNGVDLIEIRSSPKQRDEDPVTDQRSMSLSVREDVTEVYVNDEVNSASGELSQRVLVGEWSRLRVEAQLSCAGAFVNVRLNGTEQFARSLSSFPPGQIELTLRNSPLGSQQVPFVVKIDNVKIDVD